MKKKLLILSGALLCSATLTLAAVNSSNTVSYKEIDEQAMKLDSWTYNSSTDVIVDSLYEDDEKRSLTSESQDSGFSYGEVDIANSSSADSGIFRVAGERFSSGDRTIRFEIKFDESIDVSKLILDARTSSPDAWAGQNVPLTQTINADGVLNENIVKGEWINLDFSFNDTFPEVSAFVGFSIYNSDPTTNTGIVQIRRVYTLDSTYTEEYLYEDFKHASTQAPYGAYWGGIGGAGGTFVHRYVTISDGNSYTYKNGESVGKAYALVNVRGDFSGASVAPVSADGTVGSYTAWASLVDRNNEALVTSSDGYTLLDIYMGEFAGISITSTTTMYISEFGASDCVERATELYYPNLDKTNAVWYNDFDITYTDKGWPTEYAPAPTALINHGIGYAVNYSDGADVTFDGEAMVIPHLSEGSQYGSFFLGLSKDIVAKNYMVVSVEVLDGATLDSFRFNITSNAGEEIRIHNAYSDYGLKTYNGSVPAYYPYSDGGKVWLIYDLNETGIDYTEIKGELNIYWGHTEGSIKIHEIFFSDKVAPAKEIDEASYSEIIDSVAGTTSYVYGGYVPANRPYYTMTITAGEGGTRLTNLALEQAGIPSKYLKDGQLIGVDGNPIEDAVLADGESVTLIIDLEASGYDTTKSEHYHMHWDKASDYDTGANYTISRIGTYNYVTYTSVINNTPVTKEINAGYVYFNGYDVPTGFVGDYLIIEFASEEANETALSTVRLEMGGKTLWFDEGQADHLVDRNGNALGVGLDAGTTIKEICLSKSGVSMYDLPGNPLHIHSGGAATETTPVTLTVNSLTLSRDYIPVEDMTLPASPDYTVPTVEVSADKTSYTVGETAALTITASDDKTATEDLVIETKVQFGSGETLEDIEVTDNSFVVSKAGTYTITVTVTDEAGNSATATIQVTGVDPVGPGEESTSTGGESTSTGGDSTTTSTSTGGDSTSGGGSSEPSEGLAGWAIALIVVGCIAGAGAIGVGIYFLVKKLKK